MIRQPILDEAQQILDYLLTNTHPPQYTGSRAHIAQVAQAAIGIAEHRRAKLRLSQALLAAWVAETKLYLDHPAQFKSLRHFLQHCNLGKNDISELAIFAERIVPFCTAHSISLQKIVTPKVWPRFREALPAARRACKANNVVEVQSIINFVLAADSRRTVRNKYRTRRVFAAKAIASKISQSELALVIDLPRGITHDELVAKLSTILEITPEDYAGQAASRITAAGIP